MNSRFLPETGREPEAAASAGTSLWSGAPFSAYLGDRAAGTGASWFRVMYSRSSLWYRYGSLE
jgi:hypothetical protein